MVAVAPMAPPMPDKMKRPERGAIRTVEKQYIKGKDYNLPKRIEVPILFNPPEFSLVKTNTWTVPEADKFSDVKRLEFGGGEPGTITLQLFFDTYELHIFGSRARTYPQDVRQYTDKLLEMMQLMKGLGPEPDKGYPPEVEIVWGKLKSGSPAWRLNSYITSMTQKFTFFLPDGTPVRATVDLSLKQGVSGRLRQNPTSGGQGHERVRLVKPSDRLDLIAHDEYGDAGLWRIIAEANGLRSITDLTPGTRLAIPPRR